MDDTATFWQWITFSWVSSFIKYTASNELTPEELPKLSPTQQTANTFRLLQDVVANTLLRKLALANRFDVFVDLSLTFVSVCLNYLSPFFLGKILYVFNVASKAECLKLIHIQHCHQPSPQWSRRCPCSGLHFCIPGIPR